MKQIVNLLCGVLFGFIISRVGATDYNYMIKMLMFEDLHLAFTLTTAIFLGVISVRLIKHFNIKTIAGDSIKIKPKKKHRGCIIGGILFGMGWALAGACPGTILGQVGDGKLSAIITLFGAVLGTYIFGVFNPVLSKIQSSPKK